MLLYIFLLSRQGKLRLTKWFHPPATTKEKQKIIKEVTTVVLARKSKMCNFVEASRREEKIVYRRYASLYFVAGIDNEENELMVLEMLHRYVEVLDRYFGNVCELDLIFNYQKAYYILDELALGGEIQEPSKKAVLRVISQQDTLEEGEDDLSHKS